MSNITSDAWIKCPYFLKQKENKKRRYTVVQFLKTKKALRSFSIHLKIKTSISKTSAQPAFTLAARLL